MTDQATVSLLRWLRRQLRQPTPQREHLEAAVANDDPAEARRLLDGLRLHPGSAAVTSRADRRVGAKPWRPLPTRCERGRRPPDLRRVRAEAGLRAPRPVRARRGLDRARRRRRWRASYRGREAIFRFLARLPQGDRRDVRPRSSSTCSRATTGRPRCTAPPASATAGGSTSTRCSSSGSRTGSSARCWRCRPTPAAFEAFWALKPTASRRSTAAYHLSPMSAPAIAAGRPTLRIAARPTRCCCRRCATRGCTSRP